MKYALDPNRVLVDENDLPLSITCGFVRDDNGMIKIENGQPVPINRPCSFGLFLVSAISNRESTGHVVTSIANNRFVKNIKSAMDNKSTIEFGDVQFDLILDCIDAMPSGPGAEPAKYQMREMMSEAYGDDEEFMEYLQKRDSKPLPVQS